MKRTAVSLFFLLLMGFVAGCGSKDKNAVSNSKDDAENKKAGTKNTENNTVKLTEEFFPITLGIERTFSQRSYSPKSNKDKNPRRELIVKDEKMIGVWRKPHATEVQFYGADCFIWDHALERKSPLPPVRQKYRKTDRGIEIGDTHGTGNPKEPGSGLTYWVAFLKWDTKPGDSWKTEVVELERTFSATFEKIEVHGGKPCASIVLIQHDKRNKSMRLERYWLMAGVGLVKSEHFFCDTGQEDQAYIWRPGSDRTFGEWKGDSQPLTYQERQP